MKIFDYETLEAFKLKHPLSRNAINQWINITSKAKWKNIEDIRADFSSVDYIPFRDFYCFNISGNNYRLIAVVLYKTGIVKVNEIFTHAEYDKWNKKR